MILNFLQKFSLSLIAVAPLFASAQNCFSNRPATAPNERYTDNFDGTIYDKKTMLEWKKCPEGYTYDSGNGSCNLADTIGYSWQEAFERANAINTGTAGENLGHGDWRLPNVKELTSLYEMQCTQPTINTAIFFEPEDEWYMSSTPVLSSSTHIYFVSFSIHTIIKDWNGAKRSVRFVRRSGF